MEIPDNRVVPMRVGSSWSYHRICHDCAQDSSFYYTASIDYEIDSSNRHWYHLHFNGLFLSSGEDLFWSSDSCGFYEWSKLLDRSYYRYFPLIGLSNYYEELSGFNPCTVHTGYSIDNLNCTVNNSTYDSWKFSFDTAYADTNCGIWLIPDRSIDVRFISKGVGIVKEMNPLLMVQWHQLNSMPDSAFSTIDELIHFEY